MSIHRFVPDAEGQTDAVSEETSQEGLDKKVGLSPLDKLVDFLRNDWRAEIEVYVDYYTRLWSEARKVARSGMTHNPLRCIYPDGEIDEIDESECVASRTQFYVPGLTGSLERYPVGIVFAWQDVAADWGWNLEEGSDFDQVLFAHDQLLEWQKAEKFRQRLLENQEELRAWFQTYRPETLPVEPVDWERNVITDMHAFFACQAKRSRAESKYLADLQKKFAAEPVFLTETSFSQRIFNVLHRGN